MSWEWACSNRPSELPPSTVRYLGVDVEDALTLAEGTKSKVTWRLAVATSQTCSAAATRQYTPSGGSLQSCRDGHLVMFAAPACT